MHRNQQQQPRGRGGRGGGNRHRKPRRDRNSRNSHQNPQNYSNQNSNFNANRNRDNGWKDSRGYRSPNGNQNQNMGFGSPPRHQNGGFGSRSPPQNYRRDEYSPRRSPPRHPNSRSPSPRNQGNYNPNFNNYREQWDHPRSRSNSPYGQNSRYSSPRGVQSYRRSRSPPRGVHNDHQQRNWSPIRQCNRQNSYDRSWSPPRGDDNYRGYQNRSPSPRGVQNYQGPSGSRNSYRSPSREVQNYGRRRSSSWGRSGSPNSYGRSGSPPRGVHNIRGYQSRFSSPPRGVHSNQQQRNWSPARHRNRQNSYSRSPSPSRGQQGHQGRNESRNSYRRSGSPYSGAQRFQNHSPSFSREVHDHQGPSGSRNFNERRSRSPGRFQNRSRSPPRLIQSQQSGHRTPNSWDTISRSPSPQRLSLDDSDVSHPPPDSPPNLDDEAVRLATEELHNEIREAALATEAEREARRAEERMMRNFNRRGRGGWRFVRMEEEPRRRETTAEEWRKKANLKLPTSSAWQAIAERPTTNDPPFHWHRKNEPKCTLFSKLTRKFCSEDHHNPRVQHDCIYCARRHKHDECPFMKDVEERRVHLQMSGFCTRCLRSHHISKCDRLGWEYLCGYCFDENPTGDCHHVSLCTEVVLE